MYTCVVTSYFEAVMLYALIVSLSLIRIFTIILYEF